MCHRSFEKFSGAATGTPIQIINHLEPASVSMNGSKSTLGTNRRRRKELSAGVGDQENAATLELGPEFSEEQIDHDGNVTQLMALNLSEARILIREALKERKKEMDARNGVTYSGEDEDTDEVIAKVALAPDASEVLKKTLEYLDTFARFRDPDICAEVESFMKRKDYEDKETALHPFEIAQLGSLVCDEAEEAKTLIPSLANKRTDEELTELLNQLRDYLSAN